MFPIPSFLVFSPVLVVSGQLAGQFRSLSGFGDSDSKKRFVARPVFLEYRSKKTCRCRNSPFTRSHRDRKPSALKLENQPEIRPLKPSRNPEAFPSTESASLQRSIHVFRFGSKSGGDCRGDIAVVRGMPEFPILSLMNLGVFRRLDIPEVLGPSVPAAGKSLRSPGKKGGEVRF